MITITFKNIFEVLFPSIHIALKYNKEQIDAIHLYVLK